MSILYVLIPLSLVLLALGIWAFFWAVRNDQFEDLDSPAWQILLDDDSRPSAGKRSGDTGDGDA